MKKGKVFLVGAGPGDEKLLTLRAKELLKKCDVVVYDYLVNPRILKLANPKAKLISFSKNNRKNHLDQANINSFLVREALNKKLVVRLKGGDPFIFSRGPEELIELRKHNIGFEIVPGVTSGIAACEYAGIPLTQRNEVSAVSFVTGNEASGKAKSAINWSSLAESGATLVFYMGVENIRVIIRKLISHGLSESSRCCLIENATWDKQRIVEGKLSDIAHLADKNHIKPPAIFVVSKTVASRAKFTWRPGSLKGKTIVITRAKPGELSALLKKCGARIVHFPCIKIIPAVIPDLNLEGFDWIIFMGITSAALFKKQLKFIHKNTKISCIGPKTKEFLDSLKVKTTLVPDIFSSEGLAKSFSKINIGKKNILIVRSNKGSSFLPRYLRKRGARVKELAVYRIETGSPDEKKFIKEFNKGIDLVTFLSAESVRNFALILKGKAKQILSQAKIASLGPETSRALIKLGSSIDIQPKNYTIKDLVESIKRYY